MTTNFILGFALGIIAMEYKYVIIFPIKYMVGLINHIKNKIEHKIEVGKTRHKIKSYVAPCCICGTKPKYMVELNAWDPSKGTYVFFAIKCQKKHNNQLIAEGDDEKEAVSNWNEFVRNGH